jgi:hypothetical protein
VPAHSGFFVPVTGLMMLKQFLDSGGFLLRFSVARVSLWIAQQRIGIAIDPHQNSRLRPKFTAPRTATAILPPSTLAKLR